MSNNRQPLNGNEPDRFEKDAVRFGCFLLHTRHAGGASSTLIQVTLEDLSSGEKQSFTSAGAVARFLEAWPRGEARWAPQPRHGRSEEPEEPSR